VCGVATSVCACVCVVSWKNNRIMPYTAEVAKEDESALEAPLLPKTRPCVCLGMTYLLRPLTVFLLLSVSFWFLLRFLFSLSV
jgi:hypothetical protein